jgi:hypothetical protein
MYSWLMAKKLRMSKDTNQLAAAIVARATEVQETVLGGAIVNLDGSVGPGTLTAPFMSVRRIGEATSPASR